MVEWLEVEGGLTSGCCRSSIGAGGSAGGGAAATASRARMMASTFSVLWEIATELCTIFSCWPLTQFDDTDGTCSPSGGGETLGTELGSVDVGWEAGGTE